MLPLRHLLLACLASGPLCAQQPSRVVGLTDARTGKAVPFHEVTHSATGRTIALVNPAAARNHGAVLLGFGPGCANCSNLPSSSPPEVPPLNQQPIPSRPLA